MPTQILFQGTPPIAGTTLTVAWAAPSNPSEPTFNAVVALYGSAFANTAAGTIGFTLSLGGVGQLTPPAEVYANNMQMHLPVVPAFYEIEVRAGAPLTFYMTTLAGQTTTDVNDYLRLIATW